MVIILKAPDQTILYFNPFAEKVSGYPAAEVLGTNLAQLLNGQELPAGLAPEPGTEFEGSVRCKDGSRRWVVWNSERLADFRGQPANLLVGLDRTELKEVQQRAWQSERLAELGVLASGLAHEIRNPLNTIRFNLLNVQDGIAQPQTDHAEVAAMVKDIADEVDRLEGTMRDFLRLARPDPAQVEAVDVRELVESVARLVEGPSRAQNIEFSWECSPDTLAAADPKQLKQVLLNLVLNAQQAMPQGGRLELRGRAPADAVLIEVADTGPGIPDSVRDKLFEPFFSTKKEGTGLGLSICRRLVEQMYGRLDFTTAPGRGTTFVVRLPRAAQ
jgi:PAS domain S-box-containing protein